MTEHTLIRNATLVTDGRAFEGDLLVEGGRIARVGGDLAAPDGARVIDAAGLHLLPGMIDDQVHFREPGLTHKGDIASESRAAVAGGITSFMEMPNTSPTTTTYEALEAKYAVAARGAAANYAFYFGATNDNHELVARLDPRAACGVKVFMGASTGNMLVDDEKTLRNIFRDAPVPVTTHCESTPMIQRNLERAMETYGRDIPLAMHPEIRSEAACYASSELAVGLAREYGTRLHVLHLSTGRELELFEPGPMEGKQITAEVCVHFLHFCDEDYERLGNRIKCNPAIKRRADKDALIEGLRSGRLDIIATDHAPHTAEEKARDDYLTAPAGLPLVQDALLASLELVHDEHLTLPELVVKLAHNPARRFDVVDRGFLHEGAFADLVLVDLAQGTPVTAERVLARCGWSPFEGRTFRSRIVSTWVNGALAFDGERVIEHGAAMRLAFDRAG